MPQLDTQFIYQTFGQPLLQANQPVARVLTDSREVGSEDVFVALQGERFDAHDFVDEVLGKGAVLCLVSREDWAHKPGCLYVADTEKALGQLAKTWRGVVSPQLTVLGITGSSGKTTLKEMLAAILRRHASDEAVLATAGNFNNHIGLPLTLLQLKPQHRYAVIEMGMNHFGELAYLTDLARPDGALVNNALRAHVGCGFEGVADIARAKSEIYQGLADGGVGFVPQQDEYAQYMVAALEGKRICRFGVDEGDVHAEHVQLLPLAVHFDLVAEGVRQPISLPVPGRHNVHNALAAAAMALSVGVPAATMAAALADFANINGRLQQKRSRSGALVIDDTYNANPDSFKAAIDVLATQPAPRILVMGAMGELGENAPKLHAEVGAYAQARGIEQAFFVGEDARFAAEAFGVPAAYCSDKDAMIEAVLAADHTRVSFLVKGSRFMRMETVVAALLATDTAK